MRAALSRGVLFLFAAAAVAAEPPALFESRDNVLLDGARIGSLHTTAREVGASGRYRVDTELDLTLRAYGTPVRIRRDYGDEETSDGRIATLYMRQLQDGGRQLNLTGTVEAGRLHVVVDGGRIERRLAWSEDVLGLAAQERLLTERRPKAGESFSFRRYEPTFNTVVNVKVVVKGLEPVGKDGKKLLRVEFQPERLNIPGTSVQPPGAVSWLDESFTPVRRELELDGVGKVLLVRVTKETPTAVAESTADIGFRNLVSLDRRITRPHATRSAVYRITVKGESSDSFARDTHQDIRAARGDTFELHVHPVEARSGTAAGPAADEYLSPNYFVDSNNGRIREIAHRVAAGETDPLSKVQRLERWVHDSMKPESGAAFVPASQVARELRGDCRAYALLTTALCRAEGIPSRTAIGLIYVERDATGPKLGFHMWTEICLGGRWIGLDGTLGQGRVGACHLKISDHSWYAMRSLTPLLPTYRVFGKITVEVVSVDGGK
jgi:transglutaminase-like putative cysteine protease